MKNPTRREFIASSAAALALQPLLASGKEPPQDVDISVRIRGLLLGGAICDALGGPIEFQPTPAIQGLPDPPKIWKEGEKLDPSARTATAARLRLRSYKDLRPGTESYGQWNYHSLPGTITDDTRHKLILLHALHTADHADHWPISVRDLASSYLKWPQSTAVEGRPGYPDLAKDWLEEFQFSARWVLGERDPALALPPERLWQSLPTCCGQMIMPPLAAIYGGRPEEAYRAAYHMGFFDNASAKDLNAALIAGLAQALVTPVIGGDTRAAFQTVLKTMRETDPFRFRKIRWSERAVDRWLNLALKFAHDADGEPARLFTSLEKEFATSAMWEAQLVIVVIFSCLELAGYDPLAALQLCMEWGHDSDSYAQLAGVFIGALHGPDIFPAAWQDAVITRLRADHGTDLNEESLFLTHLHQLSTKRVLIAEAK